MTQRFAVLGMDPNETGYVLAILIFFIVFFSVYARTYWAVVISLIGSSLGFFCLLTQSRGIFFFLGMCLLVLLIRSIVYKKISEFVVLVSIILGMAVAALYIHDNQRFTPSYIVGDTSIGYRTLQWTSGISMLSSTSERIDNPDLLISQFYADPSVEITFHPLASSILMYMLTGNFLIRGLIIVILVTPVVIYMYPLEWVDSRRIQLGLFCLCFLAANVCNYLVKPYALLASCCFLIPCIVIGCKVRASKGKIHFILICFLSGCAFFFLLPIMGKSKPIVDSSFISLEGHSPAVVFVGDGKTTLGRFWGRHFRDLGYPWLWSPRINSISLEHASGQLVYFPCNDELNAPIIIDPGMQESQKNILYGIAKFRQSILVNPKGITHLADGILDKRSVSILMINSDSNRETISELQGRGYRVILSEANKEEFRYSPLDLLSWTSVKRTIIDANRIAP